MIVFNLHNRYQTREKVDGNKVVCYVFLLYEARQSLFKQCSHRTDYFWCDLAIKRTLSFQLAHVYCDRAELMLLLQLVKHLSSIRLLLDYDVDYLNEALQILQWIVRICLAGILASPETLI